MRVRIGAGILLLWFAACGGEPEQHADSVAHDREIERDVKVELDKYPRLTGVWPKSMNGVVTLEGTVNFRPWAEEAVRVARRARGVKNVIDHIEVQEK